LLEVRRAEGDDWLCTGHTLDVAVLRQRTPLGGYL
jgi:hypothetical protein